jgi:hypothetical protein
MIVMTELGFFLLGFTIVFVGGLLILFDEE